MSQQFKNRLGLLGPAPEVGFAGAWQPAVDIYRTRTGWLLKFELAGVSESDVTVEVHGQRLTVAGIRRDWNIDDLCAHYLMEISYNRFERVVELPCNLDHAHLDFEMRNGILVVRITEGEAL